MPKTHVVVENLFLFKNPKNLEELFYQSFSLELSDFRLVSVTGKDVETFLQGQLTNDLSKLNEFTFQINSRIDRSARLVYWLYLLKQSAQHYYLLVHNKMVESSVEELSKFIIMEDVVLEKIQKPVFFINQEFDKSEVSFTGNFQGYLGSLSFENSSFNKIELNDFIVNLQGYPLQNTSYLAKIIHETPLNEISVSYEKGCFLGQEAASKIQNNRGASKSLILFSLNINITPDEEIEVENQIFKIQNKFIFADQFFYTFLAPREYRVNGLTLNAKLNEQSFSFKVITLPTQHLPKTLEELSNTLFLQASKSLLNNDLDKTERYIVKSIQCLKTPENLEFYGVLLGRRDMYNEAIVVMDKLLEIDPSSVMAHTNKSLYFMKLGMIKEAEDEKALAQVSSFEKLGIEARNKKDVIQKEALEIEEMNKRKKMFSSVLEIDKNDDLANWGLGEIYFKELNFLKSLDHLNIAIENNPKHFKAKLLRLKCLYNLKDESNLISEIMSLVQESARSGQLQIANEAQAFLNLVSSSNNCS